MVTLAHAQLAFDRAEYAARLSAVREAMSSRGLDALIAYGLQFGMPGNVVWLAGSEPRLGLNKAALAVVLRDEEPALTVIAPLEPADVWADNLVQTTDYVSGIREVVPRRTKSIGIAGWELFPTSIYSELLKLYRDAEISPASDLLLKLRQIKSSAEIDVMREAASFAQVGVLAAKEATEPGVSERGLLVTYEHAVRSRGSDEFPFANQIGAGPQTASITAHSTERLLEDGDIVRSDTGALYRGYCSDVSRAWTVGKPSARVAELLDAGAEIYETGLAAISAGSQFSDVTRAVTRVATSLGVADYVGTVTIHGLGCNQAEFPLWNADATLPQRWVARSDEAEEQTFIEGMVCCFEPGLYVPGIGGIRLEDPFVVRPHGIERLMSALNTRLWNE